MHKPNCKSLIVLTSYPPQYQECDCGYTDVVTSHQLQEYPVFRNSIYLVHSQHADLHADAIAELNEILKSGSRIVSNSGGIQSNDLVGALTPALSKIYDEVYAYVSEVYSRWGLLRYPLCTGMWGNINNRGNYNLLHSHAMTTMSAVYYLTAPTDSGRLIFERPDDQYLYFSVRDDEISPYTTRIIDLEPSVGGIVVFPSYILHRVETNNSDEPRISLAFNFN